MAVTPSIANAALTPIVFGTFSTGPARGPASASTSPESGLAGMAQRAVPGADRLSSIDCLAKAIGYEAGNEPEAGKQAVAQVILNRVRHRAFPKTVCSVIYQGSERRTGCQFTFTCDGSLRRSLSRRTWASALAIAVAAVDGLLPPTVGMATHYHADYVAPRWAPVMVRVGRIGAHIFYHFPGTAARLEGSSVGVMVDAVPRNGRSGGQQPAVFSVWGLSPATTPTDGGATRPGVD